jgi:fructokinase
MVYTIGEIVLDIIIKSLDNATIRPGGSMLNTAISLGRLHVPVSHISILSTDQAAGHLVAFLNQNKVENKFIFRNADIKTNLALAFLDANNNANYSFYKENPRDFPPLNFPKAKAADFIHFGSFFSLNTKLHPQLESFLIDAKKANATIMYDPNFRKPHLHQLDLLLPLIQKNIALATIIKGSDEDFENIYKTKNGIETWNRIKEMGPRALIYTRGKEGCELFTKKFHLQIPTLPIEPISTIGAGDTFSAGILYALSGLISQATQVESLSQNAWQNCINLSHQFARETCKSYDNYLSVSFANNFLHVQ